MYIYIYTYIYIYMYIYIKLKYKLANGIIDIPPVIKKQIYNIFYRKFIGLNWKISSRIP